MLDYSLKKVKIKTKKNSEGKKEKTVDATLETNDISFDALYRVAAGTEDIIGKINELKDLIGFAAPLVIANWNKPLIWGSFYMQLTALSTSEVFMDETGRILEAKVTFTLSETKDKKVKKQAVTYPAASTAAILQYFKTTANIPKQFTSALKISPDKEIKALLKSKKGGRQ